MLTQFEMAMRAPALVQQFTHLVSVFQSLPSLIENSPHLSYLLGKIAKKKKRLENTKIRAKINIYRCYRFFDSLANFSRAAACALVVVVVL